MKRVFPIPLTLLIALAGFSRGDDKLPPKDALPQSETVQWDVQVLEESPSYEVVKREVKGNALTWVLENKRGLGTEITFGYQAVFLDGDGVRVLTLNVETEPFLMN